MKLYGDKKLQRIAEIIKDGKVSTKSISFWNPDNDADYQKYKNDIKSKKSAQEEKNAILRRYRMPLFCPECGYILNTKIHQKMWKMHGKCLNCVSAEETRLRATGKYELYEKEKMIRNAISYCKDLKDKFEEGLKQTTTETFIHEDGRIDKWSIEGTLNKIKKDMQNDIKIIDESIFDLQRDLKEIIKQKS